jgi:hypothetical protein
MNPETIRLLLVAGKDSPLPVLAEDVDLGVSAVSPAAPPTTLPTSPVPPCPDIYPVRTGRVERAARVDGLLPIFEWEGRPARLNDLRGPLNP